MMNNTLSKVEKENPCRKVPSPDGVVAYHIGPVEAATRVQIPVGAPLIPQNYPPTSWVPVQNLALRLIEVHPGVSNSIQLI